jgi:very-short-patch-repair endonuclease
MRSLYFTAAESGLTRAQLRHGEAAGRWTKICRATYRKGPEPPTELDRCLAPLVATGGAACGRVAGTLLGFDGVRLGGPEVTLPATGSNKHAGVRRQVLTGGLIDVAGFPCTDPLQTLIDLAAALDDDHWEQALESALRRRQVSLSELEAVLPVLSRRRLAGVVRIRRVLERRPAGAPATGSRLETLFVQLVRRHLDVEAPQRQVEIRDEHGDFVAYVDFAWPELGLFIELDGQHHADQPVHDARRETAVVAATGWLVGRFTWQEVVRYPVATARRLEALLARARERTNG